METIATTIITSITVKPAARMPITLRTTRVWHPLLAATGDAVDVSLIATTISPFLRNAMVWRRIVPGNVSRLEVWLAEQTVTGVQGLGGAVRRGLILCTAVRIYKQRSCDLSIRARPLLASTTLSAFCPGLQTTNVPICSAPPSNLA